MMVCGARQLSAKLLGGVVRIVRAAISALFCVGVVLALTSELRLRHCGSSLIPAGFPYGVEPDWFNGAYTLWDDDGWGIIGSHDETGAPYAWRIARVAHDQHLYVEVATDRQGTRYVILDRPDPAAAYPQEFLSSSQFYMRLGSHSRSLEWLDVSYAACEPGNYWRLFLYLVAVPTGIVIGLRALARSWRRRRSAAQPGNEADRPPL